MSTEHEGLNVNEQTVGAGTIVSSEAIATSIQGARAFKLRYRSIDVNGEATESSGLVIAPSVSGDNRPVLTWCHGTTGIGDAGCPSAQDDPARELSTYFDPSSTAQIDYGVPHLQAFIDDGWVVCATDYQGLGTPGRHHYTVNRSNARDALNIVHAARRLELGCGAELFGAGWSQGGGAVAALAELDDEDYGELKLRGIASLSPGIPAMALKAPVGGAAGLQDPSAPPDAHLFMMLVGIAAANPTTLRLDDLLSPLGVEIADLSCDTLPVHHLHDVLERMFRRRGPLMRSDPQNFGRWLEALEACSAGQRKPICPVMVCVDLANPPNQEPCPVPWQDAYVDAITSLGGEVAVQRYEHDDHFSLPVSCMPDAKAWFDGIRERC